MYAEIYHFKALSDRLWTGGMPTEAQLASLAAAGIEVVLNLAPEDQAEALRDEAAIVEKLGMDYLNIPITWATPTEEGLLRFMDSLDRLAGKRLFVHCVANFRASAFIALHRILRGGWPREAAFAAMREIWDESEYPAWKAFIEGMAPQAP